MVLMRSIIGSSILIGMASFAAASAMTVTPTHVELISTGSRSRTLITVVNPTTRPLPVEATILRATLDDAGVPQMAKSGEDFLIMPPQALIPPGATQNFRVQWLGDPLIESSQTFMLYMTQIPVQLPQAITGVQVVMSIGVMINVAPPRGVPNLQVVDTGVVTDRQGKRHPTLTVLNPSKVHALLPQSTITLTSANWSQTITSGTLTERIGIGLVQPGRRRTFVLPIDLPSVAASVQARIDFKPTR